jgi:hypothetical protein
MNNIEEMNDKQMNIIYIDKLNYEIQNFESNYIKEHYSINQFDDAKLNKILEKIKQFKKNNTLPDNIFWKELHKFSSKPGGFGTIKNRREIYSFILETLGRKPEYKLNSSKPTQEQINTYDTIIKNDCKRSVLYSLIKNNDKFKKYQSNKNDGEKDENQKVIEVYINELMDFTKESLGNYEYFNYFQGYQEICLYFMVIFGRKEGVKYMTLFSKIYLDYVLSKKYKINFDMLLDILNECCNIVNKKVNTLINKITKTKPYYSLSWLITYLTHSNDNIYNQMSLLDYFITSNISHMYFLSANIIVSEFNKIGTKFNITTADEEYTYMELFFQHFQKLKVSLIDYEIIIKKNEQINQNLFNEIISNMIKNAKNENDKGTLILLNKNIHDTSIFEYHSLKSQIINIIFAIILLLLVKKLFF